MQFILTCKDRLLGELDYQMSGGKGKGKGIAPDRKLMSKNLGRILLQKGMKKGNVSNEL